MAYLETLKVQNTSKEMIMNKGNDWKRNVVFKNEN